MILYGNGELGKLASQFFDFYNIKHLICEDTPSQKGVIKLEDISNKNISLIIICISTASYNKIRNKLRDKGFNNIKSFFEVAEEINKINGYKHPLTNGWKHKYSFSKKQIQKVAKMFYYDFRSYHDYHQFFIWHKEYREHYIYEVECNDRYFISEITSILHNYETFLDVGSYDGRITEKFITIVNNKFNKICCFEPDPINLEKFQNNSNISNIFNGPRCSLSSCALGNKNKKIGFKSNYGYLSKIDKKNNYKIQMTQLDSLRIEPTFIKYHLEGYELEAIKGSIKTIKKYRPIIAVTTYHTEEGLYKLPLYLIKNLKDYNFYWRNHNYQGQGAVMYCIPKERTK